MASHPRCRLLAPGLALLGFACGGEITAPPRQDPPPPAGPTSVVLSVSVGGSGSGQVTSSPAGISCGSQCTAPFPSGTVVVLTASPTGGSIFGGWSGACSGSGACTITLGQSATVTATFTAPTQTSFTTPDTYFIDRTGSFSGTGGYWSQGFTLSAPRTLVLRVVSIYAVDAGIFDPSDVNGFINGGSASGYGTFDNQFGTHYVTLPAGQYYVAVRNQSSGSNDYRVELDLDIDLDPESGHTFAYVDGISKSQNVPANGRLWQSFSIQSGYRYLLDGASRNVETYVISEGELSNFTSGATFKYFTAYGGNDDPANPGLWEMRLPPGAYYLVFRNRTANEAPVTYTMERWRIQ